MALEERQILQSLRQGAPIQPEHAERVLSPAIYASLAAPQRAVVRARGLAKGCLREFYWLTGRPGSGKTQALQQFLAQLPGLEGSGKYAVAQVAVDQELEAATTAGLPYVIVRRAMGGSGLEAAHGVARSILRGSPSDATLESSVAFGVDVIAGITQLPPVSLFATVGWKQLIRLMRLRPWYVKSQLRKQHERWLRKPHALELLSRWVGYLVRPDEQARTAYETLLLQLARSEDLFGIFCSLLSEAGYTTFVIVLDEVTPSALRGLKALWDRPVSGAEMEGNSLNLVALLAARREVRAAAEADAALNRRLCQTAGGHILLQGPVVSAQPDADDLHHVLGTVRRLLEKAPYLRRDGARVDEQNLRSKLSPRELTWQELWSEVLDETVRL